MPKIKKQTFFCTRDVYLFICVIQHRNWPLRSTILNAHGTNASPDGLCTRTRTNEAFSCWFCCNSFRADRAWRGNVCLEDQAKACSPTDQPVRKFKDSLGTKMTMKTFLRLCFNKSHHVRSIAWSGVSAAWCPQRRSRLMPSRTHSSNLHVI